MHILTRSLAVLAIAVIAYAAYAQTSKPTKPATTAQPAKSPVKDQPTALHEDLSKLSKEELEKKLGKDAYNICIMGGTERPFQNKYWDNHEAGIYLDVISGKPLFASGTKYDSRSGWPSFFAPIDKNEIEELKDTEHGMVRIEVRAKTSKAHLGHVFDDGPPPTNLRYCINSAALKFIPKDQMKAAGLEKYLPLLEEKK